MPRYYSQSFVHLLRTFGKHKCIWASDFPIMTFVAGLGELGVSDHVRRLLLADNFVTMLALGKP